MTTINVKNVDLLHTFLKAIVKFVPSCKFIINGKKCIVRARTSESASRAFFTTNSITCDEETEFCIGELPKFLKLISTFKDFNKDRKEISLTYDGAYVMLKDSVSFKLRTIDENVVSSITTPLKHELKPIAGFTLNNMLFKKLNSMAFISLDSQHESKIYIYKQENTVVGEVGDREKHGLDMVTIPLSTKTFGEWYKPILINFDKYKALNLLDCDEVLIFCADHTGNNDPKTVVSTSKIEVDDYYIKNKVVTNFLVS
jgi:hypothetical protein